jgi:predicted RNA-binding Zn-ribbon protein involved in translation (DUF1610 family)
MHSSKLRTHAGVTGMKSVFDDQRLSIPCPNCGHRVTQTVQWFRGNGKLTCPECHFIACLDTRQLKRAIAKVDQAIDDFTFARYPIAITVQAP